MEAKVKYLPNKFQEIEIGLYVFCAVTGELILLDDLHYWSVKRQEPYKDAAASLKRELEILNIGKELEVSDVLYHKY